MSYTFTEIDYRKHNNSVSLCHTFTEIDYKNTLADSVMSNFHRRQKQTIENTIQNVVVSVYVNQSHRNRLENTIVVSVYVIHFHRNRL